MYYIICTLGSFFTLSLYNTKKYNIFKQLSNSILNWLNDKYSNSIQGIIRVSSEESEEAGMLRMRIEDEKACHLSEVSMKMRPRADLDIFS